MAETPTPIDTREPLDMIHDGTHVVTYASLDLRSVAKCLHRVGMTSLADELAEIADALEIASRDIRGGYTMDLSRQLRRSEEATSNVLHAAVAGIKVAEGRDHG
jgi:hypothetical protein